MILSSVLVWQLHMATLYRRKFSVFYFICLNASETSIHKDYILKLEKRLLKLQQKTQML